MPQINEIPDDVKKELQITLHSLTTEQLIAITTALTYDAIYVEDCIDDIISSR